MTYENAVKKLLSIPKFSNTKPLEDVRRLLSALGNPERAFEAVHVAGTNGKGSVCSYISNMLAESGVKTGLFLSPHLVRVNERISINNVEISDKDFIDVFQTVEAAADENITFFGFLFAMACVYFRKRGVQTAVIETGMGGRLDATNAVPKPRLCVICGIGLDHTEVLGSTREKIAAEKAGIIKEKTDVVFWADMDAHGELMKHSRVISEAAEKKQANDIMVSKAAEILKVNNSGMKLLLDKDVNLKINLNTTASYQAQNAAIAYAAAKKLNLPAGAVKRGFENTKIKGRMQEIIKNVFIDGAHNSDGITAFLQSAKKLEVNGKRILLFGALKDKNLEEITSKILKSNFDEIYVCEIGNPRSAEAETVATMFKNRKVIVFKNSIDALKVILQRKKPQDAVFVCGSLYLIGEILTQQNVKHHHY